MYTVEKRGGKWRILDEEKNIVVTVEPKAGADDEDCKALALHLAKFMTAMGLWS